MKKTTSFRFNSKTEDLLDRLKVSTNSSSRTEVIRKALYLLQIASDEAKKSDNQTIVINDKIIAMW